jgi:hypothetical protein
MRNLTNHMLVKTAVMTSVSQMGMKSPATLLEYREGMKLAAANPNMMIVTSMRRRDEDFFSAPLP